MTKPAESPDRRYYAEAGIFYESCDLPWPPFSGELVAMGGQMATVINGIGGVVRIAGRYSRPSHDLFRRSVRLRRLSIDEVLDRLNGGST